MGSGGPTRPALQITDKLLNGAGYCRQLAQPPEDGRPLVVRAGRGRPLRPSTAPLRRSSNRPRVECDPACYRCLQRYGNQAYHGLLDWRLGLAYLRASSTPATPVVSTARATTRPSLDWHDLARRYADDLVRFDGTGSVEEFAGLVGFRVRPGGRWGLVVHPLWEVERGFPPVVDSALAEIEDRGESFAFVNTFDLARNALAVRDKLK